MSRKSGSTVSLKLSSTNPRDSRSTSPSDPRIVKGKSHKTKPIELDVVKAIITDMVPKGELLVSNLKGDDKRKYDIAVSAIKSAEKTPMYEVIVEHIKSVFSHYRTVSVGTVAAYFYGCFVDHTGSVPHTCSSVCASSVKPPNMSAKNMCPSNVAIYTVDKGLEITSRRDGSSDLIIHVPSNFSNISDEDYKTLTSCGVKTVRVIRGNSDETSYQGTLESICGDSQASYSEESTCQEEEDCDDSSGWGAIVIIAFIILLFIIAGAIFAAYRWWGSQSTVQAPVDNSCTTTIVSEGSLDYDPVMFVSGGGIVAQ